jgi:S1-C subfamily serine protease
MGKRLNNVRKESTRQNYELFVFISGKLQQWLPNGFVIFKPDYPLTIEKLIENLSEEQLKKLADWSKFIKKVKRI